VAEGDPLVDIGHDPENAKRRNEIEKDSYDALQFFLSKVIYRNLLDENMRLIYKASKRVLDKNRHRLFEPRFNPCDLDTLLESEGVRNKRLDRNLVIASVKFVRTLGNWGNNIVTYTIDLIRAGNITEAYRNIDNLAGIGRKRASVYLRDVVIIWQLQGTLSSDADLICCQPIDTHVLQICKGIGIRPQLTTRHRSAVVRQGNRRQKLSDMETQIFAGLIIRACKQQEVSPLLFNAGAWMAGKEKINI
jgi:hypothetical protein